MQGECGRILDALTALLAAEAEAVRHGALSELAALAARKAELLGALSAAAGGAAAGDLCRIRAAAEANGQLLAAALRGVAAARARLAAIRRAGTRLETYDRAGRARAVSFTTGTVERRA